MIDSSVFGFVAEPVERATGAAEDLLVLWACQASAEDLHASQHADRGAQVGGSEGASLEETHAPAASVMGSARPDPRSSVGRRPGQEWDDRQRCAAGRPGRNGSGGVPQTSRV